MRHQRLYLATILILAALLLACGGITLTVVAVEPDGSANGTANVTLAAVDRNTQKETPGSRVTVKDYDISGRISIGSVVCSNGIDIKAGACPDTGN